MSNRCQQESRRPWAWLSFDVSQNMRSTLILLFLCLAGLGLAQPRSVQKVRTGADVVVSWLATDIPQQKARANLWESLPPEAAMPQFEVISNIGWRERFHEYSEAAVAKAQSAVLEGSQLRRALQVILEREEKAIVPIAAYQATISGQPVWIVHLQWAPKMTAKFKVTKEGPIVDEKTVEGLGHIRSYAIAFDSMEVIGFSTCL